MMSYWIIQMFDQGEWHDLTPAGSEFMHDIDARPIKDAVQGLFPGHKFRLAKVIESGDFEARELSTDGPIH
jgi:hypothetical protein